MDQPVPALAERATRCAQALERAESVLVVSHIDTDGLTSAAIASRALERADITHDVRFSKQLDAAEIADIADTDSTTVLFTDFGSGQLEAITEQSFTPVVADHHQPATVDTEYHLNPLLEGIDGASELSGAGTTYVLARALESESTDNRDLGALAVVGAVGDRQRRAGELVGANTEIAAEAVSVGVLDTSRDLAIYGTQTRPLPALLAYSSELQIPGIADDKNGAIRFLAGLDLELRSEGRWRRWAELGPTDRQTLVSALCQKAIRRGVSSDALEQLVGTTYTLTREEPGSELRDASEFSTLLNATARYDRAGVGLGVCLGDREELLEDARTLLQHHRQQLSDGVSWIEANGVTDEEHVQWFHAGSEIRDTVVGIVAGMATSVDAVDPEKVIIGFAANVEAAETEAATDGDPPLKVSARGTHALVDAGLDLSAVIGEAARAVDGDGGGHDVAAGGTVPAGTESVFLEHADRLVGDQLSGS